MAQAPLWGRMAFQGSRSEAPDADGHQVAFFCPDPVYYRSHDQETDGIDDHKCRIDIAILFFAPSDGFLKIWGQDPKGSPVDIKDGGGHEQEHQDEPSEFYSFFHSRQIKASYAG